MSTKVAVASNNKKTANGHAGHCKNFYIYEIDTKGEYTRVLKELDKEETLHYTFHDDKSDNPTNFLFEMDIILVTKIGIGAFLKLEKQGTKAYVIEEGGEPDDIIDKLIAHELRASIPRPETQHQCSCGGHDDEH